MRRISFKTICPKSIRTVWLIIVIGMPWLLWPLSSQAQYNWENCSGEKTVNLPFSVSVSQVGTVTSGKTPAVFAAPIFIAPHFIGDECLMPLVHDMLRPRSGCWLASAIHGREINFSLLADNPNSLDYCSVRRYAERTDLNMTPPDLLEIGQVTTLCVRNDTISLRNLLRKGKDTIQAPNDDVLYIYSLTPGWNATIQEAPTEYGSRSRVKLKADVSFTGNALDNLPRGILWSYRVGNAPAQQFDLVSEKTEIDFSLQDIQGGKAGANILIDAGASANNRSHLKTVRFYPELPPVAIKTQIIEPTDSVLRKLQVKLIQPLNANLQEQFTTLTCYKSISTKADGVFNISESEVLFQMNVSGLITQTGTMIPITIPRGKELSKGTYFFTLEGTVTGQSNHPDHNSGYSAASMKAMFPCHKVEVAKNDLTIQNLTVTPAKCPQGKGSCSFTHTRGPLLYGTSFEVAEWIGDQWITCPLFHTSTSQDARYNTIVTVRADSLPQGDHRFAFRQLVDNIPKAHCEFDGSIPVVPPIEWTIQTKHISGTVIENGASRTTADGHIVIRKDLIKNGTPPYTVSYGTLNAQGMMPSSMKAFPHDTLHVTQPGNYYFLVSDKNVCGNAATESIKVLDNILGATVQTESPISCHGAGDGVLKAVPTGNVNARYLDFNWTVDGKTVGKESVIGGVQPGKAYTVEVRHRLLPRLSVKAAASLTEPTAFSMTYSNINHVKCFGQHTGSAFVSVSGGTPPLEGFWDGLRYGFKIEDVPAGRYNFKVFDAHNCWADYSVYIQQPAAPLRIVVDSLQHVHYDAQGQMQLGYFDAHAEGGTPPLGKVSWFTFALPQKNKLGGSYPLTVGDANGCTADTTLTVESYDRLSASIIKTQEVSCFNGYDAACALLIRGGNPPFDIRWSNGDTTRGLQGVPAGTYRATVTDAKRCRVTAEVIFNEPAPITADSLRVEPPSYAGYRDDLLPATATDGRVTAWLKGGTPPYRYAWRHTETARTIYTELPLLENCESGHYRLTVFDARECFASFDIEVPAIAPLKAEAAVEAAIACQGDATGRLCATATGGTPPYRFSWRNLDGGDNGLTADGATAAGSGAAADTADSLRAGRYEVRVTDAKGVSATATIVLDEPERLRLSVAEIQAASYGGGTDGQTPAVTHDGIVRVRIDGGSGLKQLQWTDESGRVRHTEETADHLTVLDALCGGWYRLTAVDANTCRDTLTVTVPQAAALSCSVRQTDSILCHGGREAMAQAFVEGGTPPYRYRFRYEGQDGVSTVSAVGGAADATDSGLSEADGVTADAADGTDTTGGAELVFPMFWNLKAGLYTFYVEDRNGVESSYRFLIAEPAALQGELRLEPSPCHAPEIGVVTADVRGGLPPYRYDWQYNGLPRTSADAGTDAVLTGLGNGLIEVRISDRNGCPLVLSDVMTKPEPLTVRANVSEEHYAGSRYGEAAEPQADGAVSLDVRGGTPPYRYDWWACDGVALDAEDDGAETGGTANVDAEASGMAVPGLRLEAESATLDGRCHSHYAYRVTDAHGCQYDGQAEIPKTPDLTSRLFETGIISCADRADGALSASVTGGTPPYRYDWTHDRQPLSNDGQTASPDWNGTTGLNHLAAGGYRLRVTDAKGVESVDSCYLAAPQPLTARTRLTAVSGWQAADGHIDWHIEGGRAPYMAAWHEVDEAFAEALPLGNRLSDSLRSGVYRLSVTDSSQCRFEQDYFVDSPDSLMLTNLRVFHCHGTKAFLEERYTSEDNGQIRAYVQGGVPPYRIVWRRAAGNPLDAADNQANAAGGGYDTLLNHWTEQGGDIGLSDLTAGRYELAVEDAHGYGLTHSFDVELSTAVQALLVETTSILCHGDSGVVAVRADGGKAPYTYRWFRVDGRTDARQDGATDALGDAMAAETTAETAGIALPFSSAVSPPLPSGIYRVTVTDVYGVTATDRLQLGEPAPLRLAADLTPLAAERPDGEDNPDVRDNPDDEGTPAGLLHPNPTGGCPPYRYDWAHGDTSDHIAYHKGRHYAVTVHDRNGCALRREFPFDGQSGFEARISCPQPVSCHGLSDGALDVEILGGQPPYRVLWQHGDTGVSLQHLPAARYSLAVIDAAGNTCAAAFNLTEPDPLTLRIAPAMPRCAGRADGSLSAEVYGGSYPYRYQWRNGPATAVYSGLAAGSYHLTVTDRHGCTLRDSIRLDEPAPLQPVLTVRQPTCPDDPGQLYADATGGTPPYLFQWHHADYTSAVNRILSARTGYYLLTVSDSLQCQADTNITIVRAPTLRWQAFEPQYLCVGQSTRLKPRFTTDTTDLIGYWTLPDGQYSTGLEVESDQDGLHRLTIVQHGACLYQDTARIVTVDDSVSCRFWISTQLHQGETVTAVDVSSPSSDSSHWTLPPEAELLYAEGPYAEFYFRDTGTFDIMLTSFRGYCSQSLTTRVEVLSAEGFQRASVESETPFDGLRAVPNPATGHTRILFAPAWDATVEYALIEAATGRIHQRGIWRLPAGETAQTLDLPNQAGLYVLVLHSGQTTRQLKLIVTKH